MSTGEDVRTDREDLTTDSSVSRSVWSRAASLTNTRRGFIGTAVAGVGGIGLVGSASASQVTEYDDEYDTVLNVVDLGADNSGQESITPILESNRRHNTLYYFPPGQYYMDSQFRFTGTDNLGFVGDDATLIPANYYDFDGPQFRLFRLGTGSRPVGRVRFEGFDVDQTAPDTGIRVIDTYARERLDVRGVHIHGHHDSGTWGPGHFNLTEPDGTGIVERFRAPDGGAWIDNTPHDGHWRGPIGIEANQNRGRLTFRRCWLGGFPDNGLYASGGSGQIIVNGGVYRNSNGANIRVGGDNSRIEWPTVEVTETRPEDRSQRGIRLENGSGFEVVGAAITITSPMPTSRAISLMNTCESARIERSRIEMRGEKINHGIVVSQGAGEVLVEETDIIHETSGGYPVWIRETDSRDRVLLRFVRITGEAGDASGFRDGIRCERHNCRFSACEVDQRGRDGARRHGIVNTGDDTTIYMGTYRAPHYPAIELGWNTTYRGADLESHGNREAICLYDESRDIELLSNRLVNGIKDYGSSGLVTWNNTYS